MIPLLVGIVLLVLSSELIQPPIFITLETIFGWLLVVYGAVVILLGLFGGGPPVVTRRPLGRRYWY